MSKELNGFIEGLVLGTTGLLIWLKTTNNEKQLKKLKNIINKRLRELKNDKLEKSRNI